VSVLLLPGVLLADDAAPAPTTPAAPAMPPAQPSTAPAAAPSGDGAVAAEQPQPQAQAQGETAAPAPANADPVVRAAKKQDAPKKPAKVHAAAAGSIAIQDFAFAPKTVNVNAGDTVTWTNRDSAAHTATGNGGSFNTGTLKKGQSASHTFSKAGRFAYICAIHPNMHGTVVVTAVTAVAPSSSAPTQARPDAAAAQQGGATLPNTGLQLGLVVLLGALFTAAGIVVRRIGQRSNRSV
jgi:plastocyanin